MGRDEIIHRILTLAAAGAADGLMAEAVAPADEALYFDALEAFGGWEGALAHAVVAAVTDAARRTTGELRAPVPARGIDTGAALAEREPHAEAFRPVLVLSSAGFLAWYPGDAFAAAVEPAAPAPPTDWPEALGTLARVIDAGELSALLALSEDGRALGWDARLVPDLSEDDELRRLGAESGVRRWVTAFDRTPLRRDGLFVTVTASGKLKVSQNTTFPQPVTSEGAEACLLDEGDALVDAHLATRSDRILIAASNGYAIVFALRDVRPQGRKATGVRGIGLRDGARVVGSLLVAQAPEIALVTAGGFGKRMPVRDFRPQSRAGLGLVAAKLPREDRVAAVTGCAPGSDLLLLTNRGNALRLPAEAVPVQGRSTRGSRIIALAGDERVTGLARLLPQAFDPPAAQEGEAGEI